MKKRNAYFASQLNKRKRRKILQRCISVLSAISVFITCYVLIIPAITMSSEDADTVCGIASHRHSEECFDEDGNLICQLPEHEHDMLCYAGADQKDGTVCGYLYEHTHDESCYENGELVCSLIEHTHTEECILKKPQQELFAESERFAVRVNSPAGVLPENSTLTVTDCAADSESGSAIGFSIAFGSPSDTSAAPTGAVYVNVKFKGFESSGKASLYRICPDGSKTPIGITSGTVSEINFSDIETGTYMLTADAFYSVDPDGVIPANAAEREILTVNAASEDVYSSIMADGHITKDLGKADQWQIIKGMYTGNTVSDKKDIAEQIRAQKNVIPTSVENEFLIYLSVDINYERLITEQVISQETGIVFEKNNASNSDGSSKHQDHCNNAWNNEEASTAIPVYSNERENAKNRWKLIFQYTIGENQYTTEVIKYAAINTYNQGYVSMLLGDIWYQVGRSQKGDADSTIVITLQSDMVERVLNSLQDVQIGTVSDSMGSGSTIGGQTFDLGEGVFATEIIESAVKGKSVNDNPATANAFISEDSRSIVWTPTVSSLSGKEADSSGWFENVAELVYRIKYVPPKSTGLSNGGTALQTDTSAQFLTNQNTSIAYTSTNLDGSSRSDELDLTSPQITGLLYEIKFNKTDQDSEPLEGAEFELYTKDADGNHTVKTAVSDKNGTVSFDGLPAGTYYFKETSAPSSYTADNSEYGPYTVSYTASSYNPLHESVTSGALSGQGKGSSVLLVPPTPITVVNTYSPAVVLPNTGGIGTCVYYTAGIAVTAAAFSIIASRKHKKRRCDPG